MRSELDYLQDLERNPGATAAAVAGRLGVKAAAAATALRRAEAKNLVRRSAEDDPARFALTTEGTARLHPPNPSNLEEANSLPVDPDPLRAALREEVERLVGEKVEQLVREKFAATGAVGSGGGLQSRAAHLRAILEEPVSHSADTDESEDSAQESEESPLDPNVLEFYGLTLALSDVSRSDLHDRSEALRKLLDVEVVEAVERLVELEESLAAETDSWWGPDKKKVEELRAEITELRELLGFSSQTAEGEEEGAGEGGEGDNEGEGEGEEQEERGSGLTFFG